MLKRIIFLLAVLACVLPAWAQTEALTIPRNLEQLTVRSAVILRGTVVRVRAEKHPELGSLDTVVVTLRVKETLKGQAGSTFTFRQYVWGPSGRKDVAGYGKGQDLLLMMIAPSRYGLSSPAGLEQGRFLITHEASGREIAVNGRGNLKLFEGVSAEAAAKGIYLSPSAASLVRSHVAGPIEARDLTAMIREFSQRSP